jgi:hypothetical protein
VIVVDGLEAMDKDGRNPMAALLNKLSAAFPEWLRLLLLSRESEVLSRCLDVAPVR